MVTGDMHSRQRCIFAIAALALGCAAEPAEPAEHASDGSDGGKSDATRS